ncbi:MAG: hypothetical protein AAGG38_12295 [Planctomycetota bacterium]
MPLCPPPFSRSALAFACTLLACWWASVQTPAVAQAPPLQPAEGAAGAAPPVDGYTDPRQWFETDLAPDALDRRTDRLLKTLGDWENHRGELWPPMGPVVFDVNPGTQAEAKGVRIGEVVVLLDNQPVTGIAGLRDLRSPGPGGEAPPRQRLRLLTPGRGTREISVWPGQIGFKTRDTHWTYRTHLAQGPRDPRWDRYLVAASTAVDRHQPAIAAAALCRAVELGYRPDLHSEVLTFRILLQHLRWQDAAQLVGGLPYISIDQPLGIQPSEACLAALALGDWDRLREALAQRPHGLTTLGFDLEQTREWFALHPQPSLGPMPRPTDLLKDFRAQRPLNPELTPRPGFLNKGRRAPRLTQPVQANRPFKAESPPGHFTHTILDAAEPVRDFLLHAEFTIEPNGNPDPDWPHALTVSVLRSRENGEHINYGRSFWNGPYHLLNFSIARLAESDPPAEQVSVRSSGIISDFDFKVPGFAADGETVHTLRMLRVGRVGQIELDGQTLLLMPMDPFDTGLGLFLHGVGYRLNFSRFEWSALENALPREGLARVSF